jgi:hypothetical protein
MNLVGTTRAIRRSPYDPTRVVSVRPEISPAGSPTAEVGLTAMRVGPLRIPWGVPVLRELVAAAPAAIVGARSPAVSGALMKAKSGPPSSPT